MIDKKTLRADLKRRRTEFVAAIPESMRALLFSRPPAAIADLVPDGAVVSVFHEMAGEVPASNYARWFAERGHRIALPWLAARSAPMLFREWSNPFADDELVSDPYQALQPRADAPLLVPDVMFCPLLGFTTSGGRIGYGAGFYDRWLMEHRPTLAIGLAWDCQLEAVIPIEPHDQPLDLVVTQTRVYGPWS
ncbi:MAG: 5-formyltetrahydrofolate cyclo-ligase [Novosphingobium sp.]|uniref:5-formyltetrahydrofolate cyclo-ligase n=1 Tax=Novosphingobium sp. TaxID=1874826 RepID=UPI0032BCC521